ncbi:tRNA-dihydrouridine synthase [Desulfamplus magnetovallimortis]|uniref:tRNA-dihydrouridine synthase n=1 Tax=Desulfamplus magnetovallimortis TaxID=1246637 RepID=A0A1W1HBQ6_9BACT|nr:tRNA-dihydrouridine synthase family protein [Desulfamplus magnetovallimortis]SLM29924.1 tRNA-dihydrouridine synthase [Desulfamplus magnetovallimortis]
MTHEIILAPLQGYTDAVFRDIYFRHFDGIESAMAPFISTMGEHRLNLSRLKDILPENNSHARELIPQILGNVAGDFLFLAKEIEALGYDIVNWNMGCPHSKVAKKKRGSGMLPWPGMVDELLASVFEELPCRLSIKLRLGRHDREEILRLLPVFEKYPIEELIVHPRTGVQMYTGKADLDYFRVVSDNTSHNLVYNGDIVSLRFFEDVACRFSSIKRFMIGRGVLANPFLPSEIKGNVRKKEDDLDKIKMFHDELFDAYSQKFYGPVHVTGRMKGFWGYMGPSFPESRKFIKRMLKAKGREDYRSAAELFFQQSLFFCRLNSVLSRFDCRVENVLNL